MDQAGTGAERGQQPQTGTGEASHSADRNGGRPLRVLIVEDEAITALHLELLVADLGYDVCAVESTGEGAVAAARLHRPDLVLMDIRLAGALDGIAAASRIRQDLGIPSMLLTAYSDPGTQARVQTCDSLGLLPKPYTVQQVERMLSQATTILQGNTGGAFG
ncbi:response regulator [Oleisolibacter albus]|uniref:response regulator n=1 Tax=Oleisolibacter albus TaxID=2171757 RepID=UPI000DF32844|nr:response regulator [Oleisolibacter albus]